jgi:hypothetical protein
MCVYSELFSFCDKIKRISQLQLLIRIHAFETFLHNVINHYVYIFEISQSFVLIYIFVTSVMLLPH